MLHLLGGAVSENNFEPTLIVLSSTIKVIGIPLL